MISYQQLSSTIEGSEWEGILRTAAFQGKNSILENYDPKSRTEILGRGAGGDQTLRIDDASERAIHKSLDEALGRDSYIFLSEEIGEVRGGVGNKEDAKPIVICDPLDGSHNAQVGLPLFAVSLSVVGLREHPRPNEKRRTFSAVDAAFILSVPTSDEFSAIRDMGAFHNGTRLRPRTEEVKRLQTLLIECGDADFLKQLMQRLSSDFVYKTRILGSAAMSYCFLANGGADGFVFAQPGGARTIDSPAGYLIAKEAGCEFAELSRSAATIGEVEIGFSSKMNIVGAINAPTLNRLLSLFN